MKFELPALPYALNALEPTMSARTLEFHWGKHEAAYINNLNGLIEGTPLENDTLEEIVRKADGAIYNNAAQAWNHIFFFFQFGVGYSGMVDACKHFYEYFFYYADVFESNIGIGKASFLYLVVNDVVYQFCDVFFCFIGQGAGCRFYCVSHHNH